MKEECPDEISYYDLSYLAIIDLIGDKAQTFLQGQLSANILEVNATNIRQAALCNLKGRIKALVDVIYWQGHFSLILPSDLVEETLKALTLTANLSRVKLSLNPHYKILGIKAKDGHFLPKLKYEAKAWSDNAFIYAIDSHDFILLSDGALAKEKPLYGSLTWHQRQLEAKSVEIYPESSGLFLPQRLDLHLKGYLNFEKGCYKGQEIIARMHYRSKPKHHLQLFKIEYPEELQIGKRLMALDSETELGELIDYCPIEKNQYLIAASILFDAPKEVLFEGYDFSFNLNLVE